MDFVATSPRMGAVIRGKEPVSSVSFHEDGLHLFIASEDDSRLRLVDCQKGSSERPVVKFEREGIRVVEATHHNLCVLFSGKGSKSQPAAQRNAVHYLSLYDNKLLRNFRGHSGDVTDISMSPTDDTFITSSTDRTVRMWNLEQAGCIAQLELPPSVGSAVHSTFDSTGLVFGVTAPMAGGGGQHVHLYDARQYGAGPFADLKVEQSSIEKSIASKGVARELAMDLSRADWTSMRFNKSGKQLLVSARKGLSLVLDGFDASVSHSFIADGANPALPPAHPPAVCFTPDDKTILVGNENGSLSCWNAQSGELVRKLEGHVGRVGCVAANPKYSQLASSCTNTALWIW